MVPGSKGRLAQKWLPPTSAVTHSVEGGARPQQDFERWIIIVEFEGNVTGV